MSPDSFSKRQREKERREKAASKAARRAERQAAAAEAADEPPAASPVDEAATIAELEALHARFADDEISFEDFEARKADLMARLQPE